jgi:hypothetical protein
MRIRAQLAMAALAVSILAGCQPPPAGFEINFAMYPEEFEGLQVEVNGEVIGELKRFGGQHATRFLVPMGEHEVRVLHPSMECRPATVTVESRGLPVMLMLDVMETVDREGRYRTMLTLY